MNNTIRAELLPVVEHTMITRTVSHYPAKPELDLREHFLLVVQGPKTGQRIPFGSQPLKLGRKDVCDVVVSDPEVSGQHCEVCAHGQDGDAVVTDLQSTNGTYINGKRIQGALRLTNGALLRIGSHVFKHEFRLTSEIEKTAELDRDLEKADHYVQSLLPPPILSGSIQTDWFFQPSTKLGGDAFGYQELDAAHFACYLIDVSGHGVGAAMHGVTVMNVLRQRSIPDTDFSNPSHVLTRLNDIFQMESHAGMYFSIWYGVFNRDSRELHFSSAGHHPAFMVQSGQDHLQPLRTKNLVIGAMPEVNFSSDKVVVAENSGLYVFSDGVFEVVTKEDTQWDLPDFLPLILSADLTLPEQARSLYDAVVQVARPGPLDDDFSMLIVKFL